MKAIIELKKIYISFENIGNKYIMSGAKDLV